MNRTPLSALSVGALTLAALMLPATADASTDSCDTAPSWADTDYASATNFCSPDDGAGGFEGGMRLLTDDFSTLDAFSLSFSFDFTDEAAIDNGFALAGDISDMGNTDLVLIGVGSPEVASGKVLSIRDPRQPKDAANEGVAFTPVVGATYTVDIDVDGDDITATLTGTDGTSDTITRTVSGDFAQGLLLFGTDNGGQTCITDVSMGDCVDAGGGGTDDGTVTVTFDGETVGERLSRNVNTQYDPNDPVFDQDVYVENGVVYFQVNSAEGAGFVSVGGDVGVKDTKPGDAAGAPIVFYNLDGSPITYVRSEGLNQGTDKYPTWVGSQGITCQNWSESQGRYVGVAGDWYTAAPNATTPETLEANNLAGLECDRIAMSVMTLGPQASVFTSITFDGVSPSYTPDGTCDVDDQIVNNTNGIADDCDLDDDGILDTDDCDSGDASVGLATSWYYDEDGDGLGEETVAVSDCIQPSDYAADFGDLCPTEYAAGSDDTNNDGCLDILEDLTLTAETSHVRWFETRTGKKRVDGVRQTFDKNKSHARFHGTMELTGGLLAPDFRDASDNGLASIQVTMGATSPVTVYDSGDLLMDVYDQCNGSTADNREKWKHRDQYLNEYGAKPYSHERATLRWRNSMRYRSWQEAGYPAMSDEDNLGRIHSKAISVDESRVRVRWNRKTDLPLTVALNGVTLVTIEDNGDNTYTVDSAYDSETVFRGNGTERKRVIDVMYPDNLTEGDELVWYSGTDQTGTQLYDQTLEENAASTSNTDSVWYNAGGRFHLRVPIGDDIVDGSLSEATDAAEQVATVSITVGDTSTPGAAVTGEVTYSGYVVTDGHWRIAETDEDQTDGGTQGGTGGSSSGQGGNQSGTTCQTNASDDPEP